jgi:hypothetical protein
MLAPILRGMRGHTGAREDLTLVEKIFNDVIIFSVEVVVTYDKFFILI